MKETSRDRAVIVVTHDIESARAYADRIVEMKDGEIISDTFIGKRKNKDTYNDVFENKDEKKKRFGALDIREHLLLGAASFKSSIRKSISAFSVITLCFWRRYSSCRYTLRVPSAFTVIRLSKPEISICS